MSLFTMNVTVITMLFCIIITLLGLFIIKNPTIQAHFITFALTVLCVALGSISIDNYRRLSDDQKKKPEVKSNLGYSIGILVVVILIFLLSIVVGYVGYDKLMERAKLFQDRYIKSSAS